ncbi:biotin transport system substrate-specific component [Selenomonas ruminantium]|uniref:Biotin transporter n=1 Tax=Selenomonas ruminantium TaxID=971 RepID=A0A1M6RRQ6_SELRU|nr:biotin transporter BioY [Selenomonas ruminantium]SHK35028.1 biotin transport system substrate-specific component [Selenomonas ruminantium]
MQKESTIELPQEHFTIQELTKMALCVAFCCVSAFISFPLPFTPGLVTALTIALTVTAFVLPPKLTFIAVASYVFLGTIGLPIFPGGVGGIGRILGPTGGFYLGWPFVCLLESWLKGQTIQFRRYALVAVLAGVPLTYIGGLISIMLVMQVGLWQGLTMAVFPFIPGDILKALLAAFIAVRVNKMLQRNE